jgi:hypothetical protein
VIFGIAPAMHFRPMLVEASIYKGFPRFRTRFGPYFLGVFKGEFCLFFGLLKNGVLMISDWLYD